MQKFRGFVAVFMLIMTFTSIHGFYIGDDDYHLPDAPKSEAQMYFDTIPEEGELENSEMGAEFLSF